MSRSAGCPRHNVRRLAGTALVLLTLVSSAAFTLQNAIQRPTSLRVNFYGRHQSLLLPTMSTTHRQKILKTLGSSSVNGGDKMRSSTRLSMYNLPPSGGGGGNQMGDIVKGAFSIVLVVAFFASPLGAIFFGFFNSILVLIFVLPIIATVGFQIWQSMSTISGSCPNCGAPAVVLKSPKDGPSNPSLCFNCGAILQANYENTAIENVSGRTTIDDLSPLGGGNSFFDVFSTTTSTTAKTPTSDGKNKRRGEGTIIDVDVEDEEIPFQ